jgi:hypothetical protein
MVDRVRVQRATQDFFDQNAKNWHFQQHAVHEVLHFFVALPGLHEEVKPATQVRQRSATST